MKTIEKQETNKQTHIMRLHVLVSPRPRPLLVEDKVGRNYLPFGQRSNFMCLRFKIQKCDSDRDMGQFF